MSEVSVELRGKTELGAKLDRLDPELQSRLRPFMATSAIRLRDMVKANIADAFKSTGPLYQSVQSEIEEEPGRISGRVFTQGVPYARIQEEGGRTAPHEIVPKNANVLAFEGPAGLVFAKRVNHPGSNITGRGYASGALLGFRDEFEGGIRALVAEAVGGLGIAAE